MPKRKTQKPKNPSPDGVECPLPTPRRSIPVSEVNQIIEHEVNRVKAACTIYDDRATILEDLACNEAEVVFHERRLHQLRLENKTIRADLTCVNLAITRQLELDGE